MIFGADNGKLTLSKAVMFHVQPRRSGVDFHESASFDLFLFLLTAWRCVLLCFLSSALGVFSHRLDEHLHDLDVCR